MDAVASITSKGQTTIPAVVRDALHVAPGDSISWELRADGTARVRRVNSLDGDCLRAADGSLSEWASDADEQAYRGL